MTDLAGRPDDASAPGPALSLADIEKVIAAQAEKFEDRIKGFQRLVADKDLSLQARDKELRELKLAGLSEDERDQLLGSERDQEVERLRSENERLRLRSKFGAEVDIYEQILNAPDAESQLAVLRSIRAPQATPPATPAAPAAPDPVVPDVDLNNPPRADGLVMWQGQEMSDALAEQILKSRPTLI